MEECRAQVIAGIFLAGLTVAGSAHAGEPETAVCAHKTAFWNNNVWRGGAISRWAALATKPMRYW